METKASYGSTYGALNRNGDGRVYGYLSGLTLYSGCVSGSPLPSGTCACDQPGGGIMYGRNRYTCVDGDRGYCTENAEYYY